GEGGAAVGEGVDADAEPGDAVAAGDADEAEDEDDEDLSDLEPDEEVEVEEDDGRDEGPEDHQELALLDHVGLAGGVDELGDVEHALVNGEVLELPVDHETEAEAEGADDQPGEEEGLAVNGVHELDVADPGEVEVGLAAGLVL